jgi:hypothetical protein
LTGFGLVMGFTEHLQLVTKSNNNNSWIYTVYNSLRHALGLISPHCLHQSFGDDFQRRTFSFLWDPERYPWLRPQQFSSPIVVCVTVAATAVVYSCCTYIALYFAVASEQQVYMYQYQQHNTINYHRKWLEQIGRGGRKPNSRCCSTNVKPRVENDETVRKNNICNSSSKNKKTHYPLVSRKLYFIGVLFSPL